MGFIELISIIIILIAILLFTGMVVKKSLQWFQQSSYRTTRFIRRLFEPASGLLAQRIMYSIIGLSIILIVSVVLKAVFEPTGFGILSVIVMIASFLVSFDCMFYFVQGLKSISQERKPFRLTPRGIRLAVTSIIITLTALSLPLLVMWRWLEWYYLMLVALLGLISPIYVIIASWLTLPIETAVNRWYMKDAIRKRTSMPELKVIGITGSYGKTSTKNIIHKIASQKHLSLMTPESYNTELGITRTIREQLKPIHEVFIAEMGARQRGDIKACCEIAKPNMSVLTIVGKAHLETFKTRENIRKTKAEIVQYLDQDGIAFLNADDPNTKAILPTLKAKTVLFGIDNEDADVRAKDITIDKDGSHFIVEYKQDGQKKSAIFKTRLLGRHNIANIIASIAVGIELDIPIEYIRHAVSTIEPVEHRLKMIDKGKGITVIDDSFNSNPTGFAEAVNVLSILGKDRDKIIVTPGMVELGSDEAEENRKAGELIGKECDYIILVGKSRSKPLLEGVKKTSFNMDNLYIAENLTDANAHLFTITQEGSIILFENDLPDVYGG
jgi:UDP-N-acetylmuramoyl-tripeptide--D-alanyl-D-alanine ligase